MGKRKRAKLPQFGTLSFEEVALLLTGRGRGDRWSAGSAHRDPEAAWKAHGAELTAFWTDPRNTGAEIRLRIRGGPVLKVPGPGRRPFFWWHTEAKVPRRLVLDDGSTREIWGETWAQGLEGDWNTRRGRFAFGVPTQCPPGLVFESEPEYLARIGLLEGNEIRGDGEKNDTGRDQGQERDAPLAG